MKRAATKHRSTTPVKRFFIGFLLLVATFYTVFVPQGERWFDTDGSVCMTAEVGRCQIESGSHCPDALPAYQTPDAGTNCTDCRYVSWSVKRSETVSVVQPEPSAILAPSSILPLLSPIASTRLPNPNAHAPPNGFPSFFLSNWSPRPPPVS